MTKEWQLQSHQFSSFSAHSVFSPSVPSAPPPFVFFFFLAIIFHYLSLPKHSLILFLPLSPVWLVWTVECSDVFLGCRGCFLDAPALHLPCSSVSNLHRMFTVRQFLCIVKAMPAHTPSHSSPGFFGHAFPWFSSIWGLSENRGGVFSLLRFSLSLSLLQPASCVQPCFRYAPVCARLNQSCVCEGWQLNSTGKKRERVRRRKKCVRGNKCKEWEEGERREEKVVER